MVNRKYSSNFSTHIEALIRQKHALGYPYEESERILLNFDRFCLNQFSAEHTLTKEIGLSWAIRRETEGINTFRNRMMPVRELARHLNRLGLEAYLIPMDLAPKATRYVPHIYTMDELRVFFDVLDCIPPKKNFPIRHLVIPTFFRLIYCCGLRPIEARKLRVEDVDLLNGRLQILESKGHKDRVVMLADDVLELCRHYHMEVCRIMPGRELFFPDSNGKLYTKEWAEKTFRVQWAKTGIAQSGANPARIYDLRHSFVTHRLYLWMKEGKDVTVYLPYLSAYLGHAQLSDTAYYIHLVPGTFESMAGFDFSGRESLLPEVRR
ncbi:tyrosine-type recombinase/integrase [Tissierella praeacuta]|uniref:tyrosine-type recombinase/integrase n=1 Tax=Tissierella praeacuta TaxID=43131 RepID=UPI0028B14A02|nr:tyrosine-type recombinase/integrase [Tissierella praeacuta]